jgi:hypothetical protein
VQVISQLGDVLHVQLPQLFVEWLHALRLLTVDFAAFLSRCLMPCLSVYQQWMIYVVIVPAVMTALVAMLRMTDRWRSMGSAERSEEEIREREREVREKFTVRGYFVLFLVYPSVCRRSFSLFNCRRLGENFSVLIADFDISCESSQHSRFQLGAGLVILVFIVGVPLALFVQLYRTLRTKEENAEIDWIVSNLAREGATLLGQFSEETAKDIVATTEAGQSAAFALGFKSRFYYWESADMGRKLALVGMIIFAGQGSTAQCCLAVLLAFMFFAAQVGFWPCKLDADNQLRAACEAHIFLTCLVAVALKTSLVTEKFQADDYGAVLVSTLVMLGLYAIFCVYVKCRDASSLLTPQNTDEDKDTTDQRRAEVLSNALKMYNLGFGDKNGVLKRQVERLRVRYQDHKVEELLSDNDKRALQWAKEDLDLFAESDTEIMVQAARELNFEYEADDPPRKTVQAITNAIRGRTKRDEQHGVFLSHYQANAGPDVMELKGQLNRTHPELKEIWCLDSVQISLQLCLSLSVCLSVIH